MSSVGKEPKKRFTLKRWLCLTSSGGTVNAFCGLADSCPPPRQFSYFAYPKCCAKVLLNPFQDLLRLGSMVHNAQVSLVRVLLGYGLAALIAIPVGILMGYSVHARCLTGRAVHVAPHPPLAWVPLILAWFGTASLATFLASAAAQAGYI